MIVEHFQTIDADEYQIWSQVSEEILSRIPLKNVVWPNARTQAGHRVIDSIDLDFRLYKPDMFPRAIPGAATPFFVHLFFVNCEVGFRDLDHLLDMCECSPQAPFAGP
jgi:hypothetical protein